MVGIGFAVADKNKTSGDFFLGGRTLGPFVTAMSAEASDMSGWLLMGLPAVALMGGLPEASWTAIGLAAGTYLNWLFVAKRLRVYSHKIDAFTIPDFFARRFNRFRSKFMPNKTRIYKSLQELQKMPPKSNVYLVGSDQTWNPVISKEYALAYFLDFGNDDIKRISYASSFGTSTWTDSDFAKKDNVKRLLSRFSTLLIREDKGVEICKNEFGLNATQVVDPVLLFPSYPELTGKIKQSDDIVVYKIKNDAEFYRRAVVLGNKLSCEVRSIGSMRQLKGIKTAYPEKIENWIANIASAKYVFTDSFHGTVLSILYHRQFVIYAGDKKKLSRITSLLKLVGLENRLFTNEDSIDEIQKVLTTPIDYSEVDRILNRQRTDSINYLRKAINANG